MGAAGSLPDGSELTAPVERVEHAVLVRANLALVFVKPHAYKPDAIDFVRSSLSAGGKVKLLGECSVGAQDIAAKGLVDQHYSTIASFATSAPASDIPATEETKAAFSEAFGANFDDMVAGGAILSAEDVAKKYGEGEGDELEPMPAKDLLNLWTTSGTIVKIAKDCYVAKVAGASGDDEDDDDDEGEPEPPLFCVNGFYPALKAAYEKEEAMIRLFVVAFDPQALSWASFKEEVIGATDPAAAADTSIRKKLLEKWEALGLSEAPTSMDNGVHASAGPLEALKERMLWCGFEMAKDPTGARLCELAVWDEGRRAKLDELLANADVDVAGLKGKAFDLLEGKDTPAMYALANNFAFKEELAGVC